MHTSGFLTAPSQAPTVFTLRGVPGVRELACPGPHNLHEAMVAHDFLNLDPPQWGSGQGSCTILGLVRLGAGTQ
jgi:hypothetical protein